MKPFDDLLPLILPYAPGCAYPTAAFGIRQAAIAFCERTRLWRYADAFDTDGTDAEALVAPVGAVINEIERTAFNGTDLIPATPAHLDQILTGWREGLSGQPAYVTQTAPDTLRLVPAAAGHVDVSAWLKPDQTTEELPDFLIDAHAGVIAHGALAHILMVPGQPYSSPDLAGVFAASFMGKLDTLATRGSTGQQRAPVRTRASFL